MKKLWKLALPALCALLLAGCSGQAEEPLPASMEEEAVLAAGEAVLDQILAGEYQAVYQEFREDIRAGLTEEDVRGLVEPVFQEAGSYEEIEASDTVGSAQGEEHGIARFQLKFSEEDVLLNAAFDPDMELIGLSAGLDVSEWSFSNLVDNVTGLFGG